MNALDIELNITSTNVETLMGAIDGHIINQVVLIGRYSKSGPPPMVLTVPSTTSSTSSTSSTSNQTTPSLKILTLLTSFVILSLGYKKKKRI